MVRVYELIPSSPHLTLILDIICNVCSWDPIIKYIKDQHSAYLRKELTAMRDRHIQDTRIHCALYFINPSGHSLRPIDIIVMKKLSEVVNVVPVIAKADSLTLEEREAFKQKVCVSSCNWHEVDVEMTCCVSRLGLR